jgi:hypothetical protein
MNPSNTVSVTTLIEEIKSDVGGKTGRRDIVCRNGTLMYLKRIQGWCPDIADMSFEEVVKAKPDLPVFRLSDGIVSQNLRKTFKRLIIDTGLLICPHIHSKSK